jgi:hypothetical protein
MIQTLYISLAEELPIAKVTYFRLHISFICNEVIYKVININHNFKFYEVQNNLNFYQKIETPQT